MLKAPDPKARKPTDKITIRLKEKQEIVILIKLELSNVWLMYLMHELKISKEHIQNRWGELICVPSPFTAQVWGGEAATDSTEGRHSPRWLNKGCLVIYSNVLQWNICREKAPSLLRRPFVTDSLMYFKNNKWARTSRSHSASNLLMWGEKNETSEC